MTIRAPERLITESALTGLNSKPPSGAVQAKMRDMGTGDSQVLLARLDVGSGRSGRRPIATVELRYQDLFSNREKVISQSIVADAVQMSSYDPAWDTEVLRNVTIQRTAEGLKEIDRLYKGKRYEEAWQLARRLEQDLRSVAQLSNDSQMVKDADMMRRYQDTLSKWVQNEKGRQPQPEQTGRPAEDSGGRSPVGTATAPAVDIR